MLKCGTQIKIKSLHQLLEEYPLNKKNEIIINEVILSLDKGHSAFCEKNGTIESIERCTKTGKPIYLIRLTETVNLEDTLKVPRGIFEVKEW